MSLDGMAIARQVADDLGIEIGDDELGYVLWNETGWPAFFKADPETVLRQQLQSALGESDQ